MSPITPIVLILVLMTAGYLNRVKIRYYDFRLSLLELDMARQVDRIREQIWAGANEDDISNMIVDVYNKYKQHPLCDQYLDGLSAEITNYELGEHIKSQRKLAIHSK